MFHTGYQVTVPLKELAGSANMLTMVFRVVSEKHKEEPVYFSQRIRVPAIDDDAKGNAVLDGEFLVGEGQYHVDWLMRDFDGRICARFWDLEAKVSSTEGPLVGGVAQNVIQSVASTPFAEDPPVIREKLDRPSSVKVIVNFAPQSLQSTTLGPRDLNGLLAILRKIGSEPQIGAYSIVACSMQTQQVFYRKENGSKIDLPALGEGLKSITLGKVNVQQLEAKYGETAFLSNLLAEELMKDHPDALIFVSPKYPLDCNVPREVVDRLRGFDYPVFYLNYNLDALSFPWRDAIGKVVKQLHGLEYSIGRPRELFTAWQDIVSRIIAGKNVRGDLRTR